VAVDPVSDKEWIAAGPDPLEPLRYNVYVTWTSFGANNAVLKLGRSTDGGQTCTVSTVYAPVDDGVESSFIQFSNPVVDRSTGKLYIPFLHGGDANADYIKVLESDDRRPDLPLPELQRTGRSRPNRLPRRHAGHARRLRHQRRLPGRPASRPRPRRRPPGAFPATSRPPA
jgi:hypothetical protein